MDKHQHPSHEAVAVGHEGGDFSVRGIVIFIVSLVLSAVATFIAAAGLMNFFEWGEAKYIDKAPSPVQRQLYEQRGELAAKDGAKPQPDWYQRAVDEKVLEKTFATPRLQYDDASDMGSFYKAEKDWLDSTGKSADGSVHIPISQAIDELSQKGLPPVNGTFTPQPPLGGLLAVSEAAQNRVKAAGGQLQTPAQPAAPQGGKKK
jgi:hypothetical protein